jgi:hypothetical protein
MRDISEKRIRLRAESEKHNGQGKRRSRAASGKKD